MSIERRLYRAWRNATGCRLSAQDVRQLLNLDEAIQTRIENTILSEAGYSESGSASPDLWGCSGSIEKLLRAAEAEKGGG